MILKQKETEAIQDLQTQEQTCAEKYKRYGQQAKDTVLKDLFGVLEHDERRHYDALGQVLSGTVPSCDLNNSKGSNYEPTATYDVAGQSKDKESDCFLVTDCIGTEKLVSSEYNTNVFKFGDPGVRKLLSDIQVEEQNHAEMLYKYKTVNGMS